MQATSIDCPSCGHSFAHACGVYEPQSGLPDPPTSSEGLSDLQDRIRHLDALISQLNQEKANALRKINTVQEKTRHLPFEILSRIFQFVRPPISFRKHLPPPSDEWKTECEYFRRDTYHREEDHHLKLAGVSYRWRQVLLSTPQLWTTISLGIWESRTESSISLLDLYSQRAGDFGISVELDFRFYATRWVDNNDREANIAMLQPFFETVFTRIAPKIHHLNLIAPPPEFLRNMGGNFSLCSSLIIYDVGICGLRDPTIAMELPRLQHVFLHDICTPLILPWLSITNLDLEHIPISVAFHVLDKCLNLVKFRYYKGYSYSDLNNVEPIIHENLESLICHDQVNLFRHIRFTRLRTLHWAVTGHYHGFDNQCSPRIQIFTNLPSTLISLTLGQVSRTWEHHLQDLLLCVPQLLELRLFDCAEEAHKRVSREIGRTILPNLRRLSILSEGKIDSDMIVDMLEVLSSVGKSEGFHLELSKVNWREAASRRLQALVSSGFNVEIEITDAEIPRAGDREFPWW